MTLTIGGRQYPYVLASGVLGLDCRGYWYDRPFIWAGLMKPELFLLVTKTVTWPVRRGNRKWYDWLGVGCVRFLRDGTVNAVGLTNPGFATAMDMWEKRLPTDRFHIAVSINMEEPSKLREMGRQLNDLDIAAVEPNASCPNSGERLEDMTTRIIDATHELAAVSRHPLILKVSCVQELPEIVAATNNVVAAYSLNTVPWSVIFSDTVSPLQKRYGSAGGVSGVCAQDQNWQAAQRLADAGAAQVIVPSVWSEADLFHVLHVWSGHEPRIAAASMGAVHIPCPWKPWTWLNPMHPTRWVRRDIYNRTQ